MSKRKKREKEKRVKSERKKTISINLDINLVSELDKRARKHHLTLREQIVDIVRRSMLVYGAKKKTYPEAKVSRFVGMFSRKKPGRKKK